MPRTTEAAVIKLLEDYDDTMPLDQCIEAGNSVTTQQCVDSETYVYTSILLELIERYLSAHFYEINISRQKFRAAGKVQDSMNSKIDLNLSLTHYGQSAMVIDGAGNLAAFNNALDDVKKPLEAGPKPKVGFLWLGTDDEYRGY